MSDKHSCGEITVCPKCHPLVQQTNCINVRFKGKYNGGLPNHIVVFPSYCPENGNVSVAVIVGDNFFKKGHYNARSMSVENMARWIAESDWDYMRGVFNLDAGHKPMFKDLQDKLREHFEVLPQANGTTEDAQAKPEAAGLGLGGEQNNES